MTICPEARIPAQPVTLRDWRRAATIPAAIALTACLIIGALA